MVPVMAQPLVAGRGEEGVHVVAEAGLLLDGAGGVRHRGHDPLEVADPDRVALAVQLAEPGGVRAPVRGVRLGIQRRVRGPDHGYLVGRDAAGLYEVVQDVGRDGPLQGAGGALVDAGLVRPGRGEVVDAVRREDEMQDRKSVV